MGANVSQARQLLPPTQNQKHTLGKADTYIIPKNTGCGTITRCV
jgi:hypothetical protein